MTPDKDRVRLFHMRDAALEAIALVQDKSRPDLNKDRLLNLALVRLMEIVGEAAARISESTRKRHPEILWPKIVGLRNRLIHGYDKVDFVVPWLVLWDDLPLLVKELVAIIGTEGPPPADDPRATT